MKISLVLLLVFLLSVLNLVACSSNKSNPVIPVDNDNGLDVPLVQPYETPSEHQLLGVFNVTFDIEALEAFIEPDRTLNTHHNVTCMIPPPSIQVNSWDPVEEVVDVDVTLHNPFLFDAYDVRLIIYADDAGHLLLNPDDWTHLFDIPEGLWSNPFKAYAKYETSRKFGGTSSHQENLQIKCPGSNFTVQFAVDASHPGNCEEPYEISNFRQDVIYDQVGSSGWIYVDVFDWQDDVSEVKIDCEAIAGATDILLIHDTGNTWKLELVNNNGAPSGEYGAILFAKSTGSGDLELIDRIRIVISSGDGVPHDPVTVGEFHTPLVSCLDVCIENGYLFTLGHVDGITALDITNPSYPEIISNLPLELEREDTAPYILECSGSYALAGYSSHSNYYSRYYVVDISDPFNMEIVGSMEQNKKILSISYEGNYAVMGTGSELLVIDLSTPNAPFLTGVLDINSRIVAMQGSYVYSTVDPIYAAHYVVVVDISNPGNPFVTVDYYPLGDYPYYPMDLALNGQILCVSSNETWHPTTSSFVETVDISDPLNPVRLDYIQFTGSHEEQNREGIYGLTISDDYAIFERSFNDGGDENHSRVYLLDISNPRDIQEKTFINDRAYRNGAINGNFCYVNHSGIGTFDFTDPLNLDYYIALDVLLAGRINVTENRIAYVGSVLYSHLRGRPQSLLYVFNVSDPDTPQVLSYYSSGDYEIVTAIDSLGDHVFLALRGWGEHYHPPEEPDRLLVLDVSDLYSPVEVTFLDSDSELNDVHCSGNYLFVAAGESGLLIYDVSNPQTLDLVGSVDLDDAISVTVSGNHAYALSAGSDDALYIIEISDPSNPQVLSTFPVSNPKSIDVQENLAYVTRYSHVVIIDISDPGNPEQAVEFYLYSAVDLTVSGNYVYLVYSAEIWDLTEIQNPQYLSQLEPYYISGSEIINNYAYVSCHLDGLHINKLW